MNPRTFSVAAHQDSDLVCKLETIRLFAKHPMYKAVFAEDYYINDPNVQYKVDIVVLDRVSGAHVFNLEVEMKRAWLDEFPYKDVQFLPRKKEKWDDPDFTYGKPTHWVLFNHDASRHVVIFDTVIRELSELRMVNCQVRGEEELYYIDLSHAYFDYLHF